MSQEIYSKFDYGEKDFFKKIEFSERIKVNLLAQYPYMFDFIKSAYFETAKEFAQELHQMNEESLNSGFSTILANTDY